MKRNIGQEILDGIQAIKAGQGVPLLEAFPELATNPGGVAIRGLRCREDLTQRQLAEKTGIPQRHLSEMENNKRSIGKERAKLLAAALNADYRRFL
jgi:DNA-binding transcriptional regulator YiaG